MRLSTSRDADAGTWTIENEFLRISASAGRGRIVSLVDKRDGKEKLQQGIGFWPAEELESTALVAQQADDEQACLILSGTDWDRRLTWHAWVSLAPGVASVAVRLSVFNRGLSPAECSPHICVWPAGPMVVCPVRHAAEAFDVNGALGVVGSTFGKREWQLGPHQTATVEARILLHPDLERIDHASEHAIAMMANDELTIATAEARPNHLLLVGVEGRTFDVKVDAGPTELSVTSLASLPGEIEAFQLRDNRGKVILDSRAEEPGREVVDVAPIPSLEAVVDDRAALMSAERLPSVASAAAFALGLQAMRRLRWSEAAERFEDAAILRGDDPLIWWAKNWCLRQLNEDNEHDLPNAHYLAPLDPVLRADAYLSAPEDAKPEPLLDAWGADPQPFLEVADLLHDAGLIEARARWLEEARRRAPCKLIELLLAAAHLEQGRELAASEHVRFSATAPDLVEARRRSEVEGLAKVRARFTLG